MTFNRNLKNLHSYKKYCYMILLDINDEFINDKKNDFHGKFYLNDTYKKMKRESPTKFNQVFTLFKYKSE